MLVDVVISVRADNTGYTVTRLLVDGVISDRCERLRGDSWTHVCCLTVLLVREQT